MPDVLLFSLILLKPQNHEEGIWESSEGFPEGLLSQLTNEGWVGIRRDEAWSGGSGRCSRQREWHMKGLGGKKESD